MNSRALARAARLSRSCIRRVHSARSSSWSRSSGTRAPIQCGAYAVLIATADPDADLEHSLVEWRAYRRGKRLADIHWIDALYRAYLTALVGGTAILIAASLIGDGQANTEQVARVVKDAPDWLGVVTAAVFA